MSMAACRWHGAFWAVFALMGCFAGCGGSSSNDRPRGNANVSGNWHATATSSSVPTTADLDFFIVQSGTSLASTLVLLNGTPCASQGTLTGLPSAGVIRSAAPAMAVTRELSSRTLFRPLTVPDGRVIQVRSMARQICKMILVDYSVLSVH